MLYFDLKKIIKNNEDEEILKIGKAFNDFSYRMYYDDLESVYRVLSIPIWGNGCGPVYGSGAPIDLLNKDVKTMINAMFTVQTIVDVIMN